MVTREAENLEDYLVFDYDGWVSPTLNVGAEYKGSNRMLYFVLFSNLSGGLELWLELGPGAEAMRQWIITMARNYCEVFPETPDPMEEYVALHQKTMLSSEEAQQYNGLERKEKIRERWQSFLENDLPAMDASVQKAGLL